MQRSTAYRFLLAAVILLGVLIVIALGVLVVGLSMRLGGHRPSANATTQFLLPAGTQIVSSEVSGDRLVLRLRARGGEAIDIVDLQSGRIVAQFRSQEESLRR